MRVEFSAMRQRHVLSMNAAAGARSRLRARPCPLRRRISCGTSLRRCGVATRCTAPCRSSAVQVSRFISHASPAPTRPAIQAHRVHGRAALFRRFGLAEIGLRFPRLAFEQGRRGLAFGARARWDAGRLRSTGPRTSSNCAPAGGPTGSRRLDGGARCGAGAVGNSPIVRTSCFMPGPQGLSFCIVTAPLASVQR